jgi:diacylglycerol kinase family enzyme
MSRTTDYLPDSARRVLILVNPGAGSGARRTATEELVTCLREAGLDVAVTSERDQIARATAGGDAPQLRAVVAAGGDGTVAELVNRTPAETPIAILPLGTENLLAKYLHLRLTPPDLCSAIVRGATVRLDAGHADQRIFLLMAGCGFDADVVRRLHQKRKGHIHHWSYIKPILDTVRNYQYPPLHVQCETSSPGIGAGGPQSFKARWLFVVNLPRYAGGLRLAPQAVGTDGLLDVCGFERGSTWHLLRYLSGVIRGRHLSFADCRYLQATRLRIASDQEVYYQLDGDPGGRLPVEIGVLPERIRLVVRESWALSRGFRSGRR